MTSVTYPSGAAYSYSYDAMGRPMGMTDTVANASMINSVSYGPAGELLSIAGSYNEGRAYNSRLQLTALNGVTFNYPAANNGKISSQTDSTSGETVTYAYDALNRLITASSNQSWSQSYTYDGFGNLTQKVTQAGTVNTPVDPTTNRALAYGYDANGNQLNGGGFQLGYDVENRIRWAQGGQGIAYGYDPDNRRVYKSTWTWDSTNGVWTSPVEELHYYGITGQKLESYTLVVNGWGWNGPGSQPAIFTTMTVSNAYFGGKLVRKSGATVYADRLGSFGKYYPYGEDRSVFPPNPASGTEKFGTYFRDADTGLDYAMNRYYMPGAGRFLSPDPYKASGGAGSPSSWNRYSYVGGDPANRIDPKGLDFCFVGSWPECNSDPDPFYNPEPPVCPPGLVWNGWTCTIPIGPISVDSETLENFGNALTATDDARKNLGKVKCYDLLGFDTAAAAQKWFDGLRFNYIPQGRLVLKNGKPAGDPTPAPANTLGYGTININTNYNWGDFSRVTTSTGGTYDYLRYINEVDGTSLTSAQLGAALIIHELRHQDGAPKKSDAETVAAFLQVFNACIK